MFEFEFLADQKVLKWRLTGFWTEAVALEFKAALAREMDRARAVCPRFASLSDTSAFPVQSEPVMRILASMSRDSLAEGSRKLAILVATALNELQAQRSFSSDRIRIFRAETEAMAWLTEDVPEDRRKPQARRA